MSSVTRNSSGSRAASPRRRRAVFLGAALLALGTTAGCDGDNLFAGNTGGTSSGPPVVLGIVVADTVYTGEPVDVQVRATAPAGVATIHIRYRRALVADPAPVSPTASTDTITYVVSPPLVLPAVVPDSVLVIEAWATDKQGRVGEIRSRTVTVLNRQGPVALAAPAALVPYPLAVTVRDAL